MSTNLVPCPKINVLRWDDHRAWVECPYCMRNHSHGVELPGKRASHCLSGGQYEFILPIDQNSGLVCYEIDKRRGFFVNAGLQTDQWEENDESQLEDIFHSTMNISAAEPKQILNLHKDSRETCTVPFRDGDSFEQKRILFAISNCVRGDVCAIREYLDTSPEAELFLHGKDGTGGTTLIMAAAQNSHEMVSLLLQRGADINAINNNGRTALMEAALWGRTKTVNALLNANADKLLRDREGRCAIDLAKPSRKNEEERYDRCPPAAAENLPERERDRRYIVILLDDPNPEVRNGYTRPLSESERNNYRFIKCQTTNTITLHGPIHCYPVPYISKTVAVLDRGNQFTRIPAISGWGANALPPNDRTRPSWIDQVYYIASIVGHELPSAPKFDQGEPGKFFASHAEKKLIAYFIDRHAFTPRDKKPNEELEDSILRIEKHLLEERRLSTTWAKVCDLEERRGDLVRQRDNARDRLLYDFHDEQEVEGRDRAYYEQEVERLKHETDKIDEELSNLESDPRVVAMRAQKKEKSMLLEKVRIHQTLMRLSESAPPISLKQAVILSSNDICKDCDNFKELVNSRFELQIEMNWRASI